MQSARNLIRAVSLAGWSLAFLAPIACGIARAQSDVFPKEIVALFDDINDIDKLRVLNPLKLTPDQLDKLIIAMKKATEDYNRKLADAAVPPIRALASDIKEARAKMLSAGSGVPKDLDDKIKRIQDDFLARRKTAETNTLKSLSDQMRSILTADQIKTAVGISRKFMESDGRPTAKGTDDQFFNLYVRDTFMVYPRMVPLLEDMRKAAGSSASIGARTLALGASGNRP